MDASKQNRITKTLHASVHIMGMQEADRAADAVMEKFDQIKEIIEEEEMIEAREWLKANTFSNCPFAASAFDRETFQQFVKDLYATGVKKVMIELEAKRPDYSDTMFIDMPSIIFEREKMYLFLATCGADECTIENGLLRLWWD